MLCKSHMLLTIFSLYVFLLCSVLLNCSAIARDSITFNTSITDDTGNQTLVSAQERFELGFFTPNESLNKARYVGIWYYNSTPQTVVWVANRDNPLFDHTGVFAVTEDGNLKVLDKKGKSYWSTELESPSAFKRAKLIDSGNLILIDDVLSEIVWESFHHPTDTFLPGMNMDETMHLSSWKSRDDPAKGDFTFQRDKGIDQFITQKRSLPYWSIGESSEFISSDQIPSEIASLLSNFSKNCSRETSYRLCLPSRSTREYTYMRLVLNFNGEIQYLRKDVVKKNWVLIWREPRDRCRVSNVCGDFGSCNNNINKQLVCKCLPGFKPSFPHDWNGGDFSGGCKRKSDICGKSDTFLSLKMMKARNPYSSYRAQNESECRKECLVHCNCQAYSYESSDNTSMCSIWTENLSSLQEEYANGGRTLFARVNSSDIKLTRRDCETCGTNMIPYPLSTGPDCGDPMYFNLRCNKATGQVSFTAPGDTYQITSINSTTREIYIKRKDVDNCETRNMREKIQQINQLSTFHLSYWRCNNASDEGNSNSGMSSKRRDEIVINWDPPLEPPCNSSIDCKDWPNSTCNTTRDGKKRCLCNANFQWNNNSSLRCTQGSEGSEPPAKPLEQPSSYKFSRSLIIAIAISSVVVVIALSCAIVYISYLWKRRLARRQENMDTIQRNQALYGSERHVRNLIDSGDFGEEDKKGIDVPFFDLESIVAATDNFSDVNKLGRGGFGSVYKGMLPGGREIAVKRLSSVSLQGLGEFKNEVVLIAKLQHRNLVRLLGYCIKGEEKILLYEYMPNKSLDSFIFDRTLCMVLNWELRFNIILGIARGLLYLHQDSRLRIIHRDLKTSNILLDEEMNPKISDFGLARIFEGKQIEGTTNRVVGTYGYMAPEYALDGLFSIKSDVFSFGVVVLEIISGRRNTGFYQSKITLSLLGYAWKLWNEDQALDLMHETLRETCNTNEFLRCLNVGLLCVQEDVNDRPTMPNIVVMLGSETTTLQTPKQPAFTVRRDPSTTASSSTKPEDSSHSAIVEGR